MPFQTSLSSPLLPSTCCRFEEFLQKAYVSYGYNNLSYTLQIYSLAHLDHSPGWSLPELLIGLCVHQRKINHVQGEEGERERQKLTPSLTPANIFFIVTLTNKMMLEEFSGNVEKVFSPLVSLRGQVTLLQREGHGAVLVSQVLLLTLQAHAATWGGCS